MKWNWWASRGSGGSSSFLLSRAVLVLATGLSCRRGSISIPGRGLTVSGGGRDEEKWSEFRRGKGNFGALHGSTRTQVSRMDERPSSASSHRVRAPHS